MNTFLRCAAAACLALLCGCRSNVNRELLERELLAQENQIYQLQDQVDEYESRLDSCQRENDALLGELGRARTSGKRPAVRATDELSPPVVEPGTGEAVLPYDGLPLISPPDPKVPEGDHMAKDATAAGKKGRPGAARLHKASDRHGPIDQLVEQITLNRKLTGGHNVDGHPGDDGVMVVVEPLNAAGDLVEVPGEISIVVLDPAVEGEAARVARWDFNAQEAAGHLKRTPMGDGLHFDLRWPHSPPVHRVLNLYVRYTTADGRRLQVEKQIEVDPPGGGDKPKDRWTQTPEPAVADAGEQAPRQGLPRAHATTVRSVPDGAKDVGADDALRDDKSPSTGRGARWAPYR